MDRFDDAIRKLTEAFFDGTLMKGLCSACAVGTICDGDSSWARVFVTGFGGEQCIYPAYYEGSTKYKIDRTGYSWQELARVEKAFEQNTTIDCEDYDKHSERSVMEDQYNGLMAVVDVLCEIEGHEEHTVVATKAMFEMQ